MNYKIKIKIMTRNLNFCFSKIKSLSSPDHTPPQNQSRQLSPIVFKNYNSLYETAAPDISTVFASRRFFFSSPGRSNSIIDSSTSSSSASLNHGAVNDGTIAVPTYSPDPFMDFRRSMQEMVEARQIHDVQQNWDYLHQLLMCYFSLNPKSTHKFIVGAFADLLVTLMTAAPETSGRKTHGNRKIPR